MHLSNDDRGWIMTGLSGVGELTLTHHYHKMLGIMIMDMLTLNE
jgi:hypothetical protein